MFRARFFSPEREIKKTSEGRFEKEKKEKKTRVGVFFLSRGDREQISGEDAKRGGGRGGGLRVKFAKW